MSQPCAGEKNVCRTINSEKVIWIAGRPAPVVVWNGLVNNVQVYCGLEIAIMTMSPSNSCIQRVFEVV